MSQEEPVSGFQIIIYLTLHHTYKFQVDDDLTFDELMKLVGKRRNLELSKYKFAPKKSLGIFKQFSMSYRLSSLKSTVIELILMPYLAEHQLWRVFGQPLDLIAVNKNGIPPFFQVCCDYVDQFGMEEEGIFRKAGTLVTITEYRRQYDHGIVRPFPPNEDVNVPACIIKAFLRELPTPIIPVDRSSAFKAIGFIQTPSSQLLTLRTFISDLPEINQSLLHTIVSLARKICRYEKLNRMNPDNLSIVLGPNIVKLDAPGMDFIRDSPGICKLFAVLILNFEKLFKKDSIFDSMLMGYGDIEVDPLIAAPKDDQIYGYSPCRLYDRSTAPRTYSLHDVRLSGEGILCIHKNQLEREVPYDFVTKVSLNGDQLRIEYKGTHFIIQDKGVSVWKDTYEKSVERFNKFKKLSKDSKDIGSVVEKEISIKPDVRQSLTNLTKVFGKSVTPSPTRSPTESPLILPQAKQDGDHWKRMYDELKTKYELEVQNRQLLEEKMQQLNIEVDSLRSMVVLPEFESMTMQSEFESDSDDSIEFRLD